MKHTATVSHAADARSKKLAEGIAVALAGKDALVLERAGEITATRDAAAVELYAICAEFVAGSTAFCRGRRLCSIRIRRRTLSRRFTLPDPDQRTGPDLANRIRGHRRVSVHRRVLHSLHAGGLGSRLQPGASRQGSDRRAASIFFTLEKHRRMWRFSIRARTVQGRSTRNTWFR